MALAHPGSRPFPALEAASFVPAEASRKPRPRRPSVIAHALSGTIGSVLAEAILFPIDTIKLKVQTAAASDRRGFLATLISVLGEAGVRGLYRGIGAALIKESIHSLNYWIFHGSLFRLFTEFEDTSATSPMRRLVLNLVSKQMNWLCTVPFEVISSVNQMSEKAPGFAATAASLYQEGGLAAFYRGLTVSLILAINPAIMNTLITSMLRVRAMFLQSCGVEHSEAREHSAAALGAVTALSKIVATVLTYPLIRAKVLQQTAASVYSGQAFPSVMRQVLLLEGVGGLYRGMIAMSYKTVLWNSIMMAFKHLLGPKRAMTPPESPKLMHMPHVAREPFPAEYTQEKLDEILEYLRRVGSSRKKEHLGFRRSLGHSRPKPPSRTWMMKGSLPLRKDLPVLSSLIDGRLAWGASKAIQNDVVNHLYRAKAFRAAKFSSRTTG